MAIRPYISILRLTRPEPLFTMDFLSPRFIILYVLLAFALCVLLVHLRGRTRLRFDRQLVDHSAIFAPYNLLMYAFSAVPAKPILDRRGFPQLDLLQANWKTIREEALQLFDDGHIRAAEKSNDASFNSFFKQGWKRFYLKWYGEPLASAETLCPQTVALLKSIPSVKAAMFATLAPNSKLNPHRDPFAGSLRYHLGLITPNSRDCRIFVDGEEHAWGDGKDVVFDETYVHWVENKTDQTRVILFADVFNGTTLVNAYAGDTGVAVDSIGGGAKPSGTFLDSNLQTFLNSATAGTTVIWALEGGGGHAGAKPYMVSSNNAANSAAPLPFGNQTGSSLVSWNVGLASQLSNINGLINGSGTSITIANDTQASGTGFNPFALGADVSNWYGNTTPISTSGLGTGATFYVLSASNQVGATASQTALFTATLTSSGLSFANLTAVPIPPALWLLGSGLLGFAGVMRRKSVAA